MTAKLHKKLSVILIRLTAALLGLFALYLLSIGPVLWLSFHGAGPSYEWIEAAYTPVWRIKRSSPETAQLVDGYIGMWVTIFGRGSYDDVPPDVTTSTPAHP